LAIAGTYNLPSISQIFGYNINQNFGVQTHESFRVGVITVWLVQLRDVKKNVNMTKELLTAAPPERKAPE
jgi:hypothetical protein